MEMIQIQVQHSRSFIDHCEQDTVFECEVPVGTTAEDLFKLFNSSAWLTGWPTDGDLVIMPGDMFYPIVRDYRLKHLRSLSVGDRLIMNGHILAVAPAGFIPV